jgi:hypothetical protein
MSAGPMKKVTFLIPAHIADLITETSDLVDNRWEDWLVNTFVQSCGGSFNKPFEGCVKEFCDLMMNDGIDISTKRLNKLIPPLRKAYAREMELRKAVAS